MPLALTPWHAPPSLPDLKPEEVHLWRFPLVCSDSLEPLLDEQELQRAKRLLSHDKARAFVVARTRLRQILSGYLDMAPQSLRFSYGPAGKPALVDLADAPAFNLAHSGNWGVCAVVSRGEVGVDVETIRSGLDYAKLAQRFFSETENQWLSACPEPRRLRCFYRIWTRKEAWLKGKGGGFSDPAQDIGPAHLAGSCTCDGRWWLRSFPLARHSLAALALTQEFSLVQRWEAWHLPG
jgi:4'-phosphopantetheinyl transferase